MEAEQIKTRSELLHKETAAKYTAAMSRMKQLEKKLKRTINKSKYALIISLNTQAYSETIWACLMHTAQKCKVTRLCLWQL